MRKMGRLVDESVFVVGPRACGLTPTSRRVVPTGLASIRPYPGLTPWANNFRRSAAGCVMDISTFHSLADCRVAFSFCFQRHFRFIEVVLVERRFGEHGRLVAVSSYR